jgi:hypothetical protein
VSHGSMLGQELKKRNVDPNVTLEERRSRNDETHRDSRQLSARSDFP